MSRLRSISRQDRALALAELRAGQKVRIGIDIVLNPGDPPTASCPRFDLSICMLPYLRDEINLAISLLEEY